MHDELREQIKNLFEVEFDDREVLDVIYIAAVEKPNGEITVVSGSTHPNTPEARRAMLEKAMERN